MNPARAQPAFAFPTIVSIGGCLFFGQFFPDLGML